MISTPEKKVRLKEEIWSNILQNTRIKDTALAKQIAWEWIQKIKS